MDDVNQKLRQMELDSNSTLTNINNNIQGQGRVWDALSGRIQSVGSAFTTVGNSMQSLGGALMPITAGVTALGGAVIKTGMDFQEGMDKAQSVMGATNAETEEMIVKAYAGWRLKPLIGHLDISEKRYNNIVELII